MNNTSDSVDSSSNNYECIPVRAVKELRCILSGRDILFDGIFQTVCEQHQLCYACGFAHSITDRMCDQMALMKMYELCSQNQTSSFVGCLIQRHSAMMLLRKHVFRSEGVSLGFLFECQQKCVIDYLYTK